MFLFWLTNSFYPEVQDLILRFGYVILFVDGHKSHINADVTQFCQEHGIVLYILNPHSSHVIQPLDVEFYGLLKGEWKKAVNMHRITSGYQSVNKFTFTQVFKAAWKSATEETEGVCKSVIKSFEKAGLV